ncbi:hypothetical protein [Bradyrhizobium prioriisuperbiae]|uniref:hypothetical protein n=1 Tax=Bradyrhizobium prioriisuperbiae TaxID=2854389 RepID=UPI0028EADAE2|nr:hypothetical protein [Bradyrhizobium prioritasuperba]
MGTPFFSPPAVKPNSTDIFGFDEVPPTASGIFNAYQMVPLNGYRDVDISTGGEPFVVFSRAPDIAQVLESKTGVPAPDKGLAFRNPAPSVKVTIRNQGMEGLTEVVIMKLLDGAVTSTLAVSAKTPKPLTFKVFTLEDSLRNVGQQERPTSIDLGRLKTSLEDVKKIYLNQANVVLTQQFPLESLSIEGDLGDPIMLEDKGALINGKRDQAPLNFFEERFKSSPVRFNIVLSWEFLQNKRERKSIGGLAPQPGNVCIINPFIVDYAFLTQRIAHEMMHSLGAGHVTPTSGFLMTVDEINSNWRMTRANIDLANPSGMLVVVDPRFL